MKRLLIFKLEILYKIFFAYIGFLLIMPKRSDNMKFSRLIKNLLYVAFVLSIFCWSFYVRNIQNEPCIVVTFQMYVKDVADILGFIIFVLIRATYCLKCKIWKRLYKNLDVLNNSSTDYEKWDLNGGKLIVMFLTVHLYFCFLIWIISQELNRQFQTTLSAILMVIVPWNQFYYIETLTVLLLILLFGIRRMLIKAKIELINFVPNIKRSKLTFLKVQSSAKEFNDLFGLQLLGIFVHWGLHLIGMCRIFLMFNQGLVSENYSYSWRTVTYIGSMLILHWFGPCAIAITCDMVNAETEKLLTSCYELQETFDYRSYEYQELQSFAFYIASNKIRFTAAEFFEIKRSTLLSVIATSATYFVALVQFY